MLNWLEKRNFDIDVLCLQELKQPEDKFPFQQLEEVGYQAAVFAQPQYNGVAVCSKYDLEKVIKGFGDEYWDEQKRFLECQLNGITVINVYVPHGESPDSEKYEYKLQWYRYFLEYLQANHDPSEPLVVVGDLNVTRHDLDVHAPELLQGSIATLPAEREALENLMEWGLFDTYRHLYPQEPGYTWWNYIGGAIWKNEGMRIDYILATAPLLNRLQDIEVDLWPRRRRKPTPSDHAPLMADFSPGVT